MGEEPGAFDVPDGEHAEDITALGVNFLEVVDDIDRYENSTGEDGDACKKPSK